MISENRVIFLLVAVLSIGWVFVADYPPRAPSREAIVRCGTGATLISGYTRGRQGLVGSLRWAPFPTLLVLPMMGVRELSQDGTAACIVAGLAAALFAAFLNAWLASCRVGRGWRYLALVLLAANPMFERSIVRGESAILFAFLIVACCCFLIHWLQTLELRSLAYLSILCAFAVLTRYQAIVFVTLVFLIVLIYLLAEREKEAHTEGTLLVLLSPTVYAVCLWFAANWLIMGDATFFLRGLMLAPERGIGLRDLLTDGCEWSYCLLPLFIAVLAWVFTQFKASVALATVRGAAIAGLALLALLAEVRAPEAPAVREEQAARQEQQAIVAEVAKRYKDDKVVVSGYLGYELRRQAPRTWAFVFIHTMSLHLDEILRDHPGQKIFVLVPKDEGDGWWEDMNLKYPGIYDNGAAFTIFERAWPHWRLFGVVRTDGRRGLAQEIATAGR